MNPITQQIQKMIKTKMICGIKSTMKDIAVCLKTTMS